MIQQDDSRQHSGITHLNMALQIYVFMCDAALIHRTRDEILVSFDY